MSRIAVAIEPATSRFAWRCRRRNSYQQRLHMNLRNDLRHPRQRRGLQGLGFIGIETRARTVQSNLRASVGRPCASGESASLAERPPREPRPAAVSCLAKGAPCIGSPKEGKASSTSKASSRSARGLGKLMLTGPCITVWIARDSDSTSGRSSDGSDAEVELRSAARSTAFARCTGCTATGVEEPNIVLLPSLSRASAPRAKSHPVTPVARSCP